MSIFSDDSVSVDFDGPEKPIERSLLIDSLPPEELLKLYEEIRKRLPPLTLDKTDMEEELMLQYRLVRQLQSEVITSDKLPMNQITAVVSSVNTALSGIANLQESIYTSERFKNIESALIRSLVKLPQETAREFLDYYASEIRK